MRKEGDIPSARHEGEIKTIQQVLAELKSEDRISVAVLYGSFYKGSPHDRSDIDLAVYVAKQEPEREMEALEAILMAVDRKVSILRLDDEDESPFIIQEALGGRHLVTPDEDTLYAVWDRALHEAESIRFRRGAR
jgi:uncharacterized protein